MYANVCYTYLQYLAILQYPTWPLDSSNVVALPDQQGTKEVGGYQKNYTLQMRPVLGADKQGHKCHEQW